MVCQVSTPHGGISGQGTTPRGVCRLGAVPRVATTTTTSRAMAAAASADDRPVYAIVACVKAATARTGDAVHAFGDTAVVRGLLPSLARTIATAERAAWRIRLYLCADDTDRIYRAAAAAVRRAAPPWLDLRLHFVPAEPNRVPHNACTRQAFVDGAEYIHRTNDDIVYTTVGWLTSSADALRSLDPPNVGAVGPRVYGDGARAKSLLTVDVTHRTHLLLFADYYPPQLENWFVDDWISFAYVLESAKAGSRRRSFVLGASKRFPGPWKVLHNFTHGRRCERLPARASRIAHVQPIFPARTPLRTLPALALHLTAAAPAPAYRQQLAHQPQDALCPDPLRTQRAIGTAIVEHAGCRGRWPAAFVPGVLERRLGSEGRANFDCRVVRQRHRRGGGDVDPPSDAPRVLSAPCWLSAVATGRRGRPRACRQRDDGLLEVEAVGRQRS